ncbi:MAG: ABC transporter permease subunit [Moraxellaceae bacterium]|nr:ABC transporter permease subunit [Moraxellaceae bacterium]
MTLRDWFSVEWKLTLGRPSSWALFALFAVLLIYAATTGKSSLDTRLEAIERHQQEVSQTMSVWLQNLQLKESGDDQTQISPRTGSAMDVRFSSYLPQAPLADFAIGQSDILPYLSTISLSTPDIRIFSRYEFEDPVSLMMGGFDLSTAIIVLLPLLLIVACFDLVSADRDANRLGLTLSQGISISSLFWNRLLLRSAAVMAVLILVTVIMLLAQSDTSTPADRFMPFLVWTAGTLIYAAFWVAAIALVAAFNRRSEFNIMALLSIWLAFVFIVPSGASAILETVYPTPTRLSYLAEARETENDARLQEADIANQFILDHPEMLVNEAAEVPAFLRSNFLVNRTIDEATKPILDEFDAAARQRESSVGVIRYLSPAIIAQGLFNDLAGTSAARHQLYVQQVREFKAHYSERLGPGVVAGQALTTADFEAFDRFSFRDESLARTLQRHLIPLLFLLLMTIAAVFVVNRRLASFSIVGRRE